MGREGGEVDGVVVALQRSEMATLRSNKLVRTQPVPDMPDLLETIFETGAASMLNRTAVIEALPEAF